MKKRAPFKIHGGKHYLAKWIIENFPDNYTEYNYVEPFCGACNILLNKNLPQENYMEVINDINPQTINIFKYLRDEPDAFINEIKKINYNKETFENAKIKSENVFQQTLNEFVVRRMSRGGLKQAFCWSDRTRGGIPGELNSWKTILAELPSIANRLKNVYISNKNAIEIIDTFNHRTTLLYCDPPYLPSTRTSPEVYEYEMSKEQHLELLSAIKNYKGKALISGYDSQMYRDKLKNWNLIQKEIPNHSSQQKEKESRIECIWKNF